MFHFYLSDFSAPTFPYESIVLKNTWSRNRNNDIQWEYLMLLKIASFLSSHTTTVLIKYSSKKKSGKTPCAACYRDQIWKPTLFCLLELCEFLNVLATSSTPFIKAFFYITASPSPRIEAFGPVISASERGEKYISKLALHLDKLNLFCCLVF